MVGTWLSPLNFDEGGLMAEITVNVLTICGSLRKGSYNAMVQRALPSLAPEGMTMKAAPSFAEFPLYNADAQDLSGFPTAVTTLAEAIRAADGVIVVSPEYNFSIPGGLKNAIDWVSRLPNQPFAGKPIALQISIARSPWWRARSIRSAESHGVSRRLDAQQARNFYRQLRRQA
jgi:hypothetical protein